MKISLSSKLALVATAGASVSSAENYLPATHVRSLGLRAVEMAHENAIAGRKLQGQAGDDLFDEDSMMALMGPLMCSAFEDPELKAEIGEEMKTMGISCSKLGCDDAYADVPNLVMNCNMDAETCDVDPSTGEKFCVEQTSVEFSMGLNFFGESKMESTQCATYTSPQYMKDLGHGCWSVDMKLNFGAYVQDIMTGDVDIDEYTSDEEMASILMNYFKFDKCSGEFDDGTTCSCGLCNQGTGFELTCNNDLVSEECTPFDLSVIDSLDMDTEGPDGLSTPNVSVMRMLPSDEKASRIEEAKIAGELESSATFQEKAMAVGLAVVSAAIAVLV
jgi:hypothetical protein